MSVITATLSMSLMLGVPSRVLRRHDRLTSATMHLQIVLHRHT
jgi:hypothetical protein